MKPVSGCPGTGKATSPKRSKQSVSSYSSRIYLLFYNLTKHSAWPPLQPCRRASRQTLEHLA